MPSSFCPTCAGELPVAPGTPSVCDHAGTDYKSGPVVTVEQTPSEAPEVLALRALFDRCEELVAFVIARQLPQPDRQHLLARMLEELTVGLHGWLDQYVIDA